jgi:hypothetical protein
MFIAQPRYYSRCHWFRFELDSQSSTCMSSENRAEFIYELIILLCIAVKNRVKMTRKWNSYCMLPKVGSCHRCFWYLLNLPCVKYFLTRSIWMSGWVFLIQYLPLLCQELTALQLSVGKSMLYGARQDRRRLLTTVIFLLKLCCSRQVCFAWSNIKWFVVESHVYINVLCPPKSYFVVLSNLE